jgi:hypothetical protein
MPLTLAAKVLTLDIISATHNVHQPKYNMYASKSLLMAFCRFFLSSFQGGVR